LARVFQFGEYRFHPESSELFRDRIRIAAGTKPAILLGALLAAPDKFMTRQSLSETLWPSIHVGENNLNMEIQRIRRLLNDKAAKPRFIETVGSSGYRFIHPVEERNDRDLTLRKRAEEHCRRARNLWEKRTEESLIASVQAYQEAIDADASYALAYAGMAETFIMLAVHGVRPPSDAFEEARSAVKRAFEIQPGMPGAQCAEAWIKLCYDRDWDGAERGFNEVFAKTTRYGFAWNGFSLLLHSLGHPQKANSAIQKAWKADAISPPLRALMCSSHYFARQYPAAIEQGKRALAVNGNLAIAHTSLGLAYIQLGELVIGLKHLEDGSSLSGNSPLMLGFLGCAYAIAGDYGRAEIILENLLQLKESRYVLSYAIALPYIGLGDRDQAFLWLEKACADRSHWVLFLNVEPLLDTLRTDQRMAALCRNIGFPG